MAFDPYSGVNPNVLFGRAAGVTPRFAGYGAGPSGPAGEQSYSDFATARPRRPGVQSYVDPQRPIIERYNPNPQR